MGRWALLFPPAVPEPIELDEYRRVARMRLIVVPILALLNVGMRFRLAGRYPGYVDIFDTFVIASVAPQVVSLLANVWGLRAKVGVTAWRRITLLSATTEILWTCTAAWIEGASARPFPQLVLLILLYRIILGRRIGSYVFIAGIAAHGVLLGLEHFALIPLNPLGLAVGPTRPGVPYPEGKLLFVPLIYLLGWMLADHSMLRLRKTQHALREANTALGEAVRTDALTKLWNRRYLEERLEFELERARRVEQVLAILIMDLDEFKQVNDKLGHQAGDEALVRFADVIRGCVRKIDIAARYGGEEFVVVLPGTTSEAARVVAERIRVGQRERGIHTTVSIGVADSSKHGETMADLVAAADAALYRAKDGGRDRVESA